MKQTQTNNRDYPAELLLFDPEGEPCNVNVTAEKTVTNILQSIKESPKITAKPAPAPKVAKPKKAEVPQVCRELEQRFNSTQDRCDFLASIGIKNFILSGRYSYNRNNYIFTCAPGTSTLFMTPVSSQNSFPDTYELPRFEKHEHIPLATIAQDGTVWQCKLVCEKLGKLSEHDGSSSYDISGMTMGKWMKSDKILEERTLFINKDEITAILIKNNPFGYNWAMANNVPMELFAQAPQMEILDKAGFTFVKETLLKGYTDNTLREQFNRLCRPGSNPKEIFKTSKAVFNMLKGENNLQKWDVYRKIDKFGKMSKDAMQRSYDNNLDTKSMELISSILGMTYEGKSVFTFDQLINYLDRVDTFEAIRRDQALPLINDYLHCCAGLGIKPKTDSDSLMREHNVAARNLLYKKRAENDQKIREGMGDACKNLEKFNYGETIFFIRGIRSYDDLLDEANQQQNCLASYAERIVSGRSLIYVLREINRPDKSLVTVELSPDGHIRQKLMAHNQPIRNKAISDFIDRWLAVVKKRL